MNRLVFCLLSVAFAFVVLSGCQKGPVDAESLVREYVDAFNHYDADALGTLIADDVRWDTGSRTVKGKANVLSTLAYEQRVNRRYEFRNVVAHGDTIDFELVRSDDFVSAFEIEPLVLFPRLIVEDGLIRRLVHRKGIEGFEAFREKYAPFRQWLGESHPDTLKALEGRDGSEINSPENLRLELEMARYWKANVDTLPPLPDSLAEGQPAAAK